MLYALDLTRRQTRRVLEQAVRTQARLEIEPRTRPDDPPICGRVKSIDGTLMMVDLDDDGRELPLAQLVGTACDVRTIMSDQLYLFGTSIMDVYDTSTPRQLVLTAPDSIQVGNRRKFVRRMLARASIVAVQPEEAAEPGIGELCNVSGNGLACRLDRSMDEELLIGDRVRARFEVTGLSEAFDLAGVICNKAPTNDQNGLIVGVQFDLQNNDPAEAAAIERLRAFLCEGGVPANETEADE